MPETIAGRRVLLTDDLLTHGEQDEIPRNDVLRFYMADEAGNAGKEEDEQTIKLTQPRIIIRPSGTEPKVKIYCESKIETLRDGQEYQQELDRLEKELEQIADGFVDLCK